MRFIGKPKFLTDFEKKQVADVYQEKEAEASSIESEYSRLFNVDKLVTEKLKQNDSSISKDSE